MRRGHTEQAARDDGEQPDPVEQKYLDLYAKVVEARAHAAVASVGLIRKSAVGGQITEETTRKYRDADGQVVEEKTVKRQGSDWRAAAWYLERQHRADFGKETKVTQEVTGRVELAVNAEDVAARIRANLDRAAEHQQIAAAPATSDVVDGEVIE